MNIILARRCSNRCPYCFAAPDRGSPEGLAVRKAEDFMPVDAARSIALWLAHDAPPSLNLIGGEPFLNPHLIEIIANFRELCPKTHLKIFTGGLVDLGVIASLRRQDVSLLVNVNESRDYASPRAFTHVIALIERAVSSGFEVGLGFNIWRLHFDAAFMPRLAYRLGRDGFRWTVANPNLGIASSVVPPSDFRVLSKRCTQMLQFATELGLSPNLDCPLPVCFFDDEDLAWIARFHPNVVANLGSCAGAIDITPELEAMRCFSVSSLPRTPISAHSSLASLRKWLVQAQERNLLASPGIFEECAQCTHFKAARCQGGCLGWHSAAQAAGPELPRRIYTLVQQGRYQQVVAEVESSSMWFQTSLTLYLAALAAGRIGDRERMRRFASRALRASPDATLKDRLCAILDSQEEVPPCT